MKRRFELLRLMTIRIWPLTTTSKRVPNRGASDSIPLYFLGSKLGTIMCSHVLDLEPISKL